MIQSISPAITALRTLSKKMGIASNNVANLHTKGFKKGSASSVVVSPYQTSTNSGSAQIGRGVALEEISESMGQGALVPSGSSTDLAIGGEGFFVVRSKGNGLYYTRDGYFDFNKDGELTDTGGNVAQGWAMDSQTGQPKGAIRDITLASFSSPPQATHSVKTIVNLNASASDRTPGPGGLSAQWDGDNGSGAYLSSTAYEYSTSVKIYDSVGETHDATLYFDKTNANSDWEYIGTVHPVEDKRSGVVGDNIGLLARGTISFDSSGTMSNMSMDINDGTGLWTSQDPATDLTNGHFTATADFQGAGASTMDFEVDFGARFDGTHWINDTSSSTQYAAASATLRAGADGYPSGDLLSVSVNSQGVVTGNFSNGGVIPIYQVAVAEFTDPEGLKKLGNNLYAATSVSGEPITGTPGTNGLGHIVSNALEGSNVDLGEEMVNIMLFQRSYQANLKVIEMENEIKGDILSIIS
jgi:flagellar hook protein FlgE